MSEERKPPVAFPIIAIGLGIVVALFVAEVVLRILGIGYGSSPLESDPFLHHVHPADYRFFAHSPSGEGGGHQVYYNASRLVTNPETSASERAPDPSSFPCRIAFLGDSFVEGGKAVAYDKSFVGILERHTDCLVRNYGVSSYSPIFYLVQWRRLVREFDPTLVVVLLFSNDVASDNKYIQIARRDDQGRITAIPGPGGGKLVELLRKSYVMRLIRKFQLQLEWMIDNWGSDQDVVDGFVEENPDVSDVSADLLTTLASEITASGSRFALSAVPSKYRIVNRVVSSAEPEFSDKVKAFAEENDIPFVDLTERFREVSAEGVQLYFDRDIHFNENGQAVTALVLQSAFPDLFTPFEVNLTKSQ